MTEHSPRAGRRSSWCLRAMALLGLATLAVVLAACGSSSSNGSSSSSSSAGSGSTSSTASSGSVDVGRISKRVVPNVQAKRHYKIILLAAHQGESWSESVAQAAEHYAAAHGASLTLLDAGGYTNVQQQIAQIQAATAEKPDGIMIWATDPTAIVPTLKKAAAAGIKIENVVVPATYTAPTVTGNYVQQGESMGTALAKSMGGKGKILSVIGGQGGAYAAELHQGLKQALKSYPNIQWAKDAEIPAFDPAQTEQIVQNWLTGNPDTTGVFVTTGTMGVAAAQGVRAAGLKAGSVKIVGSLVTDCGVVDEIKSGRFALLLGDPAVMYGELGVATMIDMLNGKKVPALQVPPTNIYTPQNITQAGQDGTLFQEVEPSFIHGCA